MDNFANNYEYDGLLDILFAFNAEDKYEKLLDVILDKIMHQTNSDAGTIYILQENRLYFHVVKNKTLGIDSSIGDSSNLPPVELDISDSDSVSAYVAKHKSIVIVDDIYTDGRFNFGKTQNYDIMTGYKTKSMLVLPLMSFNKNESEVLGVIQLINSTNRDTGEIGSYSDYADGSALSAAVNIAASILPNFIRTQEISQLLNSLVDMTSQAISERSAYSRNHTQNVSMYCQSFAKYLSSIYPLGHKYHFIESEIEALTIAAYLHDVGKIVTPLEIMDKADRLGSKSQDIRYRFTIKSLQLELDYANRKISQEFYEKESAYVAESLQLIETVNPSGRITDEQLEKVRMLGNLTYTLPCGAVAPMLTPEDIDSLSIRHGTLTESERAIIQDHVKVTDRLLSKITFPERLRKTPIWAANHHEFLDGSGYPRGIAGDDIDVGSRILTIADIFDALISSDRPYKKSIPIAKSLDILSEMANEGKLDKELVMLFSKSKVWQSN